MKYLKYVFFVLSISLAPQIFASVVDIQDRPRTSSWVNEIHYSSADNWGDSRKKFNLDSLPTGDYVISFEFLNPHVNPDWVSSLSLATAAPYSWRPTMDANDGFTRLHDVYVVNGQVCYGIQCFYNYEKIGSEFDVDTITNLVGSVLVNANNTSGSFMAHLEAGVKYFLFVSDYNSDNLAYSNAFTISIDSADPSPVPLPATLWMLVSSLIGLAKIGRKHHDLE